MSLLAQPHELCTLPCFKEYEGVSFPLCVRPSSDAAGDALRATATALPDWAAEHSDELEALLRKHGALLFRGFGVSDATAETFGSFVEDGLKLPNFPYELGNAVRTAVVGDRVFTANESPPDKAIPWHHELAQTPSYPSRLLFFCERTPDTGGETPLLLSTAIHDAIARRHPKFIEKLTREGVKYSRVMTAHDRAHSAIGRGWRATFGAETRADVERKLRARGYTWEWLGEGALLRETSPVLDAVKTTVDGRRTFFNQIVAVWGGWRDEYNSPHESVMAGDGSSLDATVMADVEKMMSENRVAIPWEKGDIIYIDNMQVQHSRACFTGKRRVLASLANAPVA